MQTNQRDRVEMELFCNLERSNLVNHNGTKMVDVWIVNKLTNARTEMEVVKLQTRVVQDYVLVIKRSGGECKEDQS